MKNLYSFIASILFTVAFAQAPEIVWQNNYGGSAYDAGFGVIPTADGNYLLYGSSQSNDGDVGNNNGGSDIWLLMLEDSGEIIGEISIGGSSYDLVHKVVETADNGFIVVGESMSNDYTDNFGNLDFLVVKIDNNGGLEWKRNYGGSGDDMAIDILQTADGGYLLVGNSDSTDGEVPENHGNSDIWVLKISHLGVIEWQKSYGGSDYDTSHSIIRNTDGNYMIAGSTYSNDHQISENNGQRDIWLFEINPTGTLLWEKSYGGSNNDYPTKIMQTSDLNYLLSGYTSSQDGDVSNHLGASDGWIIKLDNDQNIEWERTYGGSEGEFFQDFHLFEDDSFLAFGHSSSSDGNLTENKGSNDFWLMRADENGKIFWQKSYGGSEDDFSGGLLSNPDGTTLVTGYTRSADGDLNSNYGDYDLWALKIEAEQMATEGFDDLNIQIYPNPAEDFVQINSKTPIQTIVVYDQSMKRVIYSNPNSNQASISVTNLPSGVYFITVEAEGELHSQKLIKK